ncbi:uncharacterized protein BT62DRAFT_1059403 [Guyanagaster necrorhizus]|uniref:CAP-Gly domain-containing protein n=1 Tax=Guyanagaster necrorhizus TaxID=856835 RepID=A0A9P7VXV7_9AGAR|nr:uncharacterized protein BT62DRAFT_1059403 [Guyanagaster necrorhizus MCA 3950]KAG7448214.1 hypothetical protein BT62DRAFT_1059403 [Guyanagaster necrorhizus MCA 3950]
MELLPIGARISLSGHIGSIRFVGSVHGTKGTWLGVEWDNPERGKHDGVKDGTRFFSCRISNSGSFIRPSSNVSYGRSFLEALQSKYIELPHGSESMEKVILGSSRGAIEIEAVNLDKIRQKFSNLDRLREISLDNELVCKGDEPGAIKETCPNVRGLDLSMSLIPSWDVVASITAELPGLTRLVLNRNRLECPGDTAKMSLAFMRITDLQLNDTLTSWDQMLEIVCFMPNLQQVEMGYNHLTRLSNGLDSTSPTVTIQSINLDSNQLNDWIHIMECLRCSCTLLTTIILTSNDIKEIPFPLEHQSPLPEIRSVSLSANGLRSWRDIDALAAWCPGLETLYIRGNPLVQETDHQARYSRQFIIAKIPSLVALDATAISSKERTDCELFYLSHISQSDVGSEGELIKKHPQWNNLRAKHGLLEEATQPQDKTDRLSKRLIELNAYQTVSPTIDLAQLLETQPLKIKALPSMALHILRQKLRKATKSGITADVAIWMIMRDNSVVELGVDHDKQDIAWLGFDHGSSIVFHINES